MDVLCSSRVRGAGIVSALLIPRYDITIARITLLSLSWSNVAAPVPPSVSLAIVSQFHRQVSIRGYEKEPPASIKGGRLCEYLYFVEARDHAYIP